MVVIAGVISGDDDGGVCVRGDRVAGRQPYTGSLYSITAAVCMSVCLCVCGVCVITFVLVLCVCNLLAVGNDLEGTPIFCCCC